MQLILSRFRRLSRAAQLVFVGSALTAFAVVLPWHTTGILEQQIFSGLAGSNLLLGLAVLCLGLVGVVLFGLPLVGVRLPRLPWTPSRVAIFLGLESFTLLFAVLLLHVGELEATLNYGLQLGLLGSALIVWGGKLLAREEEILSVGTPQEPLARVRRTYHAPEEATDESVATPETTAVESPADRRMRLDI